MGSAIDGGYPRDDRPASKAALRRILTAARDEIEHGGFFRADAEAAVTRPVADRLGETVSVRDFGAVADGTTDARPALQAAVDHAAAQGGGTVFVPAGDYRVTAALMGPDRPVIQLRSRIALCFAPGARLLLDPVDAPDYEMLNIREVEDVTIEGGELVGDRRHHDLPGENGMGVSIRGAKNVRITGTICRACRADGFYIGSTDARPYSENLVLADVQAVGNRRQALSIISARNLTVLRPRLSHTGGHEPEGGIDIEPNHPEERLQGIRIIDAFSHDNADAALILSLRNLAGSPQPIDIVVDRLRSENDIYGILIGKCFGPLRGRITIRDPQILQPRQAGILSRNFNGLSPLHVTIERPYILEPNTARVAEAWGSAVSVMTDGHDPMNEAIGNLTIKEPWIEADRRCPRYFHVRSKNGSPVRRVRIVDPAHLWGAADGRARIEGDVLVDDHFDQMRVTATDKLYLGHLGYHRTIDNAGQRGCREVHLAEVGAGWPDIGFEVRDPEPLCIIPDKASVIEPLSGQPGEPVRSRELGARLTLRRVSPTAWRVVDQIGNWQAG